jgi:hypothetical protein
LLINNTLLSSPISSELIKNECFNKSFEVNAEKGGFRGRPSHLQF